MKTLVIVVVSVFALLVLAATTNWSTAIGVALFAGIAVWYIRQRNNKARPTRRAKQSIYSLEEDPSQSRWPRSHRSSSNNEGAKKSSTSAKLTPRSRSVSKQISAQTTSRAPTSPPSTTSSVQATDSVYTYQLGTPSQTSNFKIPTPASFGQRTPHWVGPNEVAEVAGFHIAGGLIYYGARSSSPTWRDEPALIDPTLPVSRNTIDISTRTMDYWPSYGSASATARRGYLQWLITGRNNPAAHIGYVFLYFYGLERRILIDTQNEPVALAEMPLLIQEIDRLLSIYQGNGSFRRYASSLVEYAKFQTGRTEPIDPHRLIPTDSSYNDIPLALKVGLGEFARDGKPLPVEWALAWVQVSPVIIRRTPVTRCPEEFATLFRNKYQTLYGAGMLLRENKTRLALSYHPASSALLGRTFILHFKDLPDVTAVQAPVQSLQKIVDECTEELDGYSRQLGKNGATKDLSDAFLRLPVSLWPTGARELVVRYQTAIQTGPQVSTLQSVSTGLGLSSTLTRSQLILFTQAIGKQGIAVEPDVTRGDTTPKAADPVVFYALPIQARTSKGHAKEPKIYPIAELSIELACAVAAADGEVSSDEVRHLESQVALWEGLDDIYRARLTAYTHRRLASPMTLAAMRKKLELVSPQTKRSLGLFLAHTAQVEGEVSVREVKLLEKIYAALQLDPGLLYTDLHGAPESSSSAPQTTIAPAALPAKQPKTQFTLDSARIATLHKESAEIAAKLATIFADEDPAELPVINEPGVEEEPAIEADILGLESGLSNFARLLLTRDSWSRDDLLDVASDMEIMLDGALESVNEAAWNTYDEPLTEGDDPVEINHTLREKLVQ